MSDSTSSVRVRFPPSPTGFLHVGNVRTAIFNWLLARHHGGTFILRIEDTDRARLVPGAVEGIMETLRWMGMDWDEGPEVGGTYGPYVQSERLAIYNEHASRLIVEGKAYRCYCTGERLAQLREEQQRRGEPTGYDRRCRSLTPEEREAQERAGTPSVVRFAVPIEGSVTLHDLVRGPITYQNNQIEDFIIIKSDGYPPYHFAVVVDDHLMRVTHVIRGEEYTSSGGKDVLLHDALGWSPPRYAHGSVILATDRKKLGKRHGATSLAEFRALGFLPEVLFNYLALLGAAYSGDREVYSRDELVSLFDLDRMHAAPAVFDRTKLEWMNGHYINHILSLAEVTDRCMPYLLGAELIAPDTPREYVESVIALVKERIKLLPEVIELTNFFFTEPAPDAQAIAGKKLTVEAARGAVQAACNRLAALESWDEGAMDAGLTAVAEELGMKRGTLFMPLRVAISGKTVSPGLFETMRVLGRERTLARLRHAVEILGAESSAVL